ncbi:MAG: DNA repair protein RadA [Candidatus Melainabacteria bacterium]|nr:DNA repair protein RadA [Candidatus Melainabacteria bacterium]
MVKSSSKWVCQNCGLASQSYIGKCPDCNSWGSLIEEVQKTKTKAAKNELIEKETKTSFQSCMDVKLNEANRINSFDKELDSVLGGGFVQGSLVLLAGDPGIGKSTLLLQASDALSENHKVIYACAEESSYQIKLRSNRLNLKHQQTLLFPETNLEDILLLAKKEKPDFLIVDSIQAIYHPMLESSAGSISQVRECANNLMRFAKDNNITTILVGHVNKEGQIAGPKVLEHIVDTVLYFEGERFHNFRLLRATKNRFGPVDEIAVFEMRDSGLKIISNPSFLFMSQNKESTPGSTYTAITEGTKIIIAEVQALVGNTTYAAPRRSANGLDYNRVLQIIAILERRVGFNFSKHDLFVNLVGGLNSDEPAIDLSIAIAIVSCKQDVVPIKRTIYIGEIGLSGEIRQVNNIENRIKEAIKLGFEKVVIPQTEGLSKNLYKQIEIIEAAKLLEAIRKTLTTTKQTADI